MYFIHIFFSILTAYIVSVPDKCIHGDVMLVGGTNENEGTVQVCVSDLWGTICDDNWSSNDASVVCGQLGYIVSGTVTNIIRAIGLAVPLVHTNVLLT